MDRLSRTLAGCGLVLLLAASGCRSGANKVPPGRGFSGDGRQSPPIDFGSDPHPTNNTNSALLGVQPGGMQGMAGGQGGQTGTPTSAPRMSVPTVGGAYGPPGTSGTNGEYLGGTAAPNSGLPMMPTNSGVSNPATSPPLGSQPGASLPMGGAGALPGAGATGGTALP